MSETKFLIYTARDLTLTEATHAFVKAFGDNEKHYALLYGSRRCSLASVDKAARATEADVRVPLDQFFEARIFNSHAELRWLNDPEGGSDAAIVTEEEPHVFDGFGEPEPEAKVVGKIESFLAKRSGKQLDGNKDNQQETPHGYLLWGEGTGNHNGDWSEMATARVGAYHVPLPGVEHKDRVRLNAVEYLKTYADGNVGVCEERLTGFTTIREMETATQATPGQTAPSRGGKGK